MSALKMAWPRLCKCNTVMPSEQHAKSNLRDEFFCPNCESDKHVALATEIRNNPHLIAMYIAQDPIRFTEFLNYIDNKQRIAVEQIERGARANIDTRS